MTTGKALNGKPYAGNPHMRFFGGTVVLMATQRRGSLLYALLTTLLAAASGTGSVFAAARAASIQQPCAAAPKCRYAGDGLADGRPAARWRGFNLLEMFHMGRGAKPGEFLESDFRMMHEWGFNFARLPMDYRFWIVDGDWNRIDESAVAHIDRAISLGRKWGVHVQVCMHRCPGYTVARPRESRDLFTDPEAQRVCAMHWAYFAKRWKGISNEALSFNLFNEPPNVSEEKYAPVVRLLVDAIRREDPKRFIILDGIAWGRRPLKAAYGLAGVGQATRGYEPSSVSHYLAPWVGTPSAKPAWPLQLDAPADASRPCRYADPGREYLYRRMFVQWDEALANGTFVMAGEFGVWKMTPHDIALDVIEDYLSLWKERNMGWALWNLRGDFGILDSGRADVKYEDYKGHKLDRKLLELLRRY